MNYYKKILLGDVAISGFMNVVTWSIKRLFFSILFFRGRPVKKTEKSAPQCKINTHSVYFEINFESYRLKKCRKNLGKK